MNKNQGLSFLRALIVASAATFALPAMAVTYYVSDCASGAVGGCVAGSDSNAGTSAAAPWRTTAKVQSAFGGMNAGDTILFARGGAWAGVKMYLQNLNSSLASPITFDSYAATWSNTAKPILRGDGTGDGVFAFYDGGAPEPDGGYVVRNLDLRGNGNGWGIFTTQQTRDIMLENLNIQDFDIGVHCGDLINNITLRNSTLRNNKNQGILWGCINSTIESNSFDNNGWDRPVFDHSIYLAGKAGAPANMVVRNNRITNNSLDENGICQAVVIVVHGVVDGLTIENNTLYQAPHTASPGCWGIAVDAGYAPDSSQNGVEGFSRVVIRNNRVINVGGIGIGCGSCVAPVIENNVIVQESNDYLEGIKVPDRVRGAEDTADSAAIIRNNSIWFGQPAGGSIGIAVGTQGYPSATNMQVVSNLIYFAAGGGNGICFDTTGAPIGAFTAFNNNLCHRVGNAGRYSVAYLTLGQAQAAAFDVAGRDTPPNFAATPSALNLWSLAVNAASPAVGAGHATLSAGTDILGRVRMTPDIGAFEYSATADTTAPKRPHPVSVR